MVDVAQYVNSAGDITLASWGDQTYQGAHAVQDALAAAGLGATAKGLITAGGGVSAGGGTVERAYYASELVGPAGGAGATATVIDTAQMAQRVMDVRAGLPSGLRRSGNVAVAEIDIPGIPTQMAAQPSF